MFKINPARETVATGGGPEAHTASRDSAPAWDEADRVAALHAYGILDTAPEAAFDDFVTIAAHVCGTPIAVVNLIDRSRQWFKAERGLGVRETPLDISICAHAILQRGLFVVPDTTKDPRFACNPLVTGEPHLRFYGGALLETEDGLPLGTMCVLDYEPRSDGLTEQQQHVLQALARQVMAQLELRRALAARAETEAELRAAHRQVEETLNAALAQKDLLMLEAHHRVKNSLQMVHNLLQLQSRTAVDPETARQLALGAARVRTFGTLHEHLYQTASGHMMDVAPYLQRLVGELRDGLASTLEGRTIELAADHAVWPAAEVPAVGLVLTELVTNALKYGRGAVEVTFRQYPENRATLAVSDDGDGLPPGFAPGESRGLGMRLVTGLVGERGGRLDVDRNGGRTRFTAYFAQPRRAE